LTSGRKVVLAVAAGLAVITVFAIVLAMTAGAPPVEPVEATPQSARTDCPAGWQAIYDASARFSLCRPADWKPHAEGDQLTIAPTSGHGVQISWLPGNAVGPPCAGGVPVATVKADRTTRKISGVDREVCLTDTYAKAGDSSPVMSTIAYRLPVTSGGVLNVVGSYEDPAARSLILQLLDTLKAT